MFIAALFTITKRWKQLKHPSIDEQINKMRYIHKMKYYSTIERNTVSIHATTWTLKILMLNEISHT